jgi:hypothetical protein
MLRDNQSFQFGGIQGFEIGENAIRVAHCCDTIALSLQHDENAPENSKNLLLTLPFAD